MLQRPYRTHSDRFFKKLDLELPADFREKIEKYILLRHGIGSDHGPSAAAMTDPENGGLDCCVYFPDEFSKEILKYFSNEITEQHTHISSLIMEPHGWFKPHIDTQDYKENRNTIIFFPLKPYEKDNWAPLVIYPDGDENGETLEVEFNTCYATNVNVLHSVENNDCLRINIQLSLPMLWEDFMDLHEAGKVLR